MQKLILTIGPSASGKSTWAEQFCLKNPEFVNVNRDDIRINLYGKDKMFLGDENLVTRLHRGDIYYALTSGKSVVVSDTNLRKARNEELVSFCRNVVPDIEVGYQYFLDVPLSVCIERDKLREKSVGEKVIRKQFSTALENFGRVNEYAEQNKSLPSCIIVDIDGTVAFNAGRSPYDWQRVDEDLPNWPVVNIVNDLCEKYSLVFFSGRDEECREKTESWLNRYFSGYSLHMRKAGDCRGDDIVKHELYNEHVLDRFYVRMVFDDRERVVALWRNVLKLPVCQVNYGDF